jgi:cell division protein ZapA (FtsZ GTPase activity inhibitor)
MSSAQKIKVTIYGDTYTLVTDEPEEFVRATATTVDSLMVDMAQRMGNVESRKIAVLAALQLASKQLTFERTVAAKRKELERQLDESLGCEI